MRDAFINELMKIASESAMVSLITGDLGFGVFNEFITKFPNQFINAGVAEQNMTGIACGMALEGHKVYTYSIANFSTLRCLEQIRNDICYHDCDVTVVSVGGGFSYGQLGVSHFATEDLAIMRALPNIMIVAPSDPWEAAILVSQMAKITGPKYLRLDKSKANLAEKPHEVQLGKARILRQGSDITLVAIGSIVGEAMKAAEELSTLGIQARILAYHSVKPFDEDLLFSAISETKGLFSIEEHSAIGGLASTISELCMKKNNVPKIFKAIALEDTFPTIVGDQDFLRKTYKIDAAEIVKTVVNAWR